jgi:DNA-binding transcriptional regulator PaaX
MSIFKPDSTTRYVLLGLLPYTDTNSKLSYKPNIFFNELEKLSKARAGRHISSSTIRTTYYRAQKQNYISIDESGSPHITSVGHRRLTPYVPKKLKGAKLLVTFDIPENQRYKRSQLRLVLVELNFHQIQQSVWISDYDGTEILKQEIDFLNIENDVVIYEAREIK